MKVPPPLGFLFSRLPAVSGALWKSSNRRAESMFPTRKGGKLASKGLEASKKLFHEEGFKGRATGRVVDVLQGGLGGGIDASRASSVGAVFLPQHGYWAAEGRLQELKSVGAPLPFGLKLLPEAEELGLRAGIPQIPLRWEGKSNGSSKRWACAWHRSRRSPRLASTSGCTVVMAVWRDCAKCGLQRCPATCKRALRAMAARMVCACERRVRAARSGSPR